MSVQWICRSNHSKNRKGDHDLGKVFFKLRVTFDGLVSRKKVFSNSIHYIDTHIDVVVEVLEVHSSVDFELCFYE